MIAHMDQSMAEARQFCTFRLGKQFFGIDAHTVQEVIRYQTMTRVPLAPPIVSGLINLRGQIVTAINLRKRLHMNPLSDDATPVNVVVKLGDDVPISLEVDEIGDVLTVDAQAFEPPPDTLDGVARDLITGVYKLDRYLLLILNIEKVFTSDPMGTSGSVR